MDMSVYHPCLVVSFKQFLITLGIHETILTASDSYFDSKLTPHLWTFNILSLKKKKTFVSFVPLIRISWEKQHATGTLNQALIWFWALAPTRVFFSSLLGYRYILFCFIFRPNTILTAVHWSANQVYDKIQTYKIKDDSNNAVHIVCFNMCGHLLSHRLQRKKRGKEKDEEASMLTRKDERYQVTCRCRFVKSTLTAMKREYSLLKVRIKTLLFHLGNLRHLLFNMM